MDSNSTKQTFLKTESSDSVHFSLRQSLVVDLQLRYSSFEKSIISSQHAHSNSPRTGTSHFGFQTGLVRAVRCRGRLVDFHGNSGLVCQTDRLEDTRQSELEGLGNR